MVGIGHNSGRVDESGKSWRKYVWTKARKGLLPVLPIEVVRRRVNRARQLGLPYRTYAGIRASSGHDLIGFLFSNNALRVFRDGQSLPSNRGVKLAQIADAQRIGVAHAPLRPSYLGSLPGLDRAAEAPAYLDSWAVLQGKVKAIIAAPCDRFIVVGETAFEAEWSAAGMTAGYLSATRYFEARMG